MKLYGLLLAAVVAAVGVARAQNFGGGGLPSVPPTDVTAGALPTGVTLANPPVMTTGASSLLGTLASGTTFFSFTTVNPITLASIEIRVVSAGVGGAGDSVYCNDPASGAAVSATTAAAAAAGTTATASASIPVASATRVHCHIESAATTKPVYNIALSYQMQ